MKKRELKKIAKQIAEQEQILSDPTSTLKMKGDAEATINRLAMQCITSLDDVDELDELVQEYLNKK